MNCHTKKTNSATFFLFTCVKEGRMYISKLFDSLLAQTRTNFIHYIYEDGSKDPLDEMVDIYKNKVSTLSKPYKVIYEKNPVNIGLNMATKHCIELCDCPFFIWVDCDNYVDNNFFEELEKQIKKNPGAILYRTTCYPANYDKKAIKKRMKMINDASLYNKKRAPYVFFFPTYCSYRFSFFAVNYKKYMLASNNNIVDDRLLYNDQQVLSFCYSTDYPAAISKKSIGYFLARNDSEFALSSTEKNREQLIREKVCDFRVHLFKNSLKSRWYFNYNELFQKLKLFYKEYNSYNYKSSLIRLKESFQFARTNKLNIYFLESRFNIFKYVVISVFGILLKGFRKHNDFN